MKKAPHVAPFGFPPVKTLITQVYLRITAFGHPPADESVHVPDAFFFRPLIYGLSSEFNSDGVKSVLPSSEI